MDAEKHAAEKGDSWEERKRGEIVMTQKWHRVKVISEDTHAVAALVDGRESGYN